MTRYDFPTRLAVARVMVARGAAPTPVHLADQLDAAGTEARRHHDLLGAVLPVLDPGRNWRERLDAVPSTDTRAYLLAALLDCRTVCLHLRRGGPQPAFAQLPLRRIDCQRCIGTIRRPPAGEGDRCDTCGRRGVTIFHPFAVRAGPLLVTGDACPTCADVVGIRDMANAS